MQNRKLALLMFLAIYILGLCFTPQKVNANPSYEDFTTYTEVDPNSHIVVLNSTHIDFEAYEDEDAYVYYDKGADYFKQFEHKLDAQSYFNESLSHAVIWALANVVDDIEDVADANDVIYLRFLRSLSTPYNRIQLCESSSGVEYSDYASISSGTWYYFLIVKSGTSLKCGIYSNSSLRDAGNGADGDIDNLSLTLHSDYKFRYIYACSTWEGTAFGNPVMEVDIQNFELTQITEASYTYYYTFVGLKSEVNDTFIGSVDVTVYVDGYDPRDFTVDGTNQQGFYAVPRYAHFDIPGDNDREYWFSSTENNTVIYIYTDSSLTEYVIQFLDLAGILDEYSFVEALYWANASNRIVERRKVDVENKVLFSLQQGHKYTIHVSDAISYTYGELLMTSDTSIELTLKGIEFPQNVILAYRYVRLYAERHNNYSSISMLYQDTETNTDNVVCNIKYQNGTVAYTTTEYADSFNVTWTSAQYSLTYYVEMDATHNDYGTLNYRAIMYRGGFNISPWGIDWIGTIPDMQSSALIPIFLILAGAGIFSKVNAYMGAFMATILGILFVWWGWIDIAPGLLVTALVFTILMALGYKKRVVIGA